MHNRPLRPDPAPRAKALARGAVPLPLGEMAVLAVLLGLIALF
jgi:hypothetical protein